MSELVTKKDCDDRWIPKKSGIGYYENDSCRLCCQTCIYWIHSTCRRQAPSVVSNYNVDIALKSVEFTAIWPNTRAFDLCGEWARVWYVS